MRTRKLVELLNSTFHTVQWIIEMLTGLIPCAIVILGLFLIPESPRWLAKTGRQKDFDAALRKLRGKNADISEEAAEIQVLLSTPQTVILTT